MENRMLVKKVKIINDGKKNCIKIDYAISKDGIEDELTGLFKEPAAPEFYDAFKALVGHVEEILELADKDLKTRIVPYGVTFHYSKDGTMGAVISSKLTIPTAGESTVINTPMRKCLPDETTDGIFFTEAAAKALWTIERETRNFISGKRAQTSLFGDNGEVQAEQDDGQDDCTGTIGAEIIEEEPESEAV